VARTLEFNRDDALASAMHLFWRQGYSATSLHQLLEAMAIGRSSLYATYGDKRRLFIEALDLFSQRNNALLDNAFNQKKPLLAVREFFMASVNNSTPSRLARGCMMVNSILELADVDPELSKHAAKRLGEVESKFQECFELAQTLGQLDKDYSAQYLAKMIMTLNQGLRVSSRKNESAKEMAKVVETTMSMLGITA
jgi:TetR/AcrR family transcriptional repressor of nem operon